MSEFEKMVLKIAAKATRDAQAENHKKGVANVYKDIKYLSISFDEAKEKVRRASTNIYKNESILLDEAFDLVLNIDDKVVFQKIKD